MQLPLRGGDGQQRLKYQRLRVQKELTEEQAKHDRVPMVLVALALIRWVGLAERIVDVRSVVVRVAVLIALCRRPLSATRRMMPSRSYMQPVST